MIITVVKSIFSNETVISFTKFRNVPVRNRSFNSHDWLKRRERDFYVEVSKKRNYRCRSAFKLIEIDDMYKLIKPGFKVLDVGAAPGSWSQVLAERTNSNGKDSNSPKGLVIAVDISTFHQIDGVTSLINSDFSQESCQKQILDILGEGQKFDLVLSDMAPSATGVKTLDQERIVNLVYCVILFAVKSLKLGGGCLVKIWDGGETKTLRSDISKFFKQVHNVKPQSSYNNSAELFLLARDFKGLET